ncbi:MAG: aspartate aminotransferase family protein [Betaproteobacteria bacterium]|jgi:beta-alanine--pyruvate transaminase|nr:aspartate aminotransferase family protein [Pseudomonadota bacterium]NBO03437.1 aspartate aminotransferase family protein [Betaproteobacteria bacterium]NBO95862.1 aspartate aminotransferase family protein [Betaproteobacteria bacterium]NBP35037.1 aspartate aminotransferase family protein [Betaproteobacteria bacterium]NBP38653.1 aspartate aminotransferase family protein [Betaproteobacteria bacterium]
MNQPVAEFADLHPDVQGINPESYWLPFTPNRHFKASPHARTMVSAAGPYYTNAIGNQLFDCLSGMWCSPLGHAHPKIVEAVTRQVSTLDYSPAFQCAAPTTLKLAERIADMAPAGMNHVFFTSSGSESVDTALKIAHAFHRSKGEASRFRMIGRERGYHGVGFGGISVGGIPANRKAFASLMLNGVDHLPHTHNLAEMAFSKGQPSWGAHLAEDLERLVTLHDASSIAAVIVEPVQGSTGLLVPPVGYLKKLREICSKHGILLIFDEVITGFGRLGTHFAAQRFDVIPDMITFAKAVTNGVIPLGGVIVRQDIYEAFMQGPAFVIELFHGYTYSGHPMATGVGLATLDVMQEEGLIQASAALEPVLEEAIHSLRDLPEVIDIRNIGCAAAIDLKPIAGKPGLRATSVFEAGLKSNLLLRFTGDTIAMAPPFISSAKQLVQMVDSLRGLIVQTRP